MWHNLHKHLVKLQLFDANLTKTHQNIAKQCRYLGWKATKSHQKSRLGGRISAFYTVLQRPWGGGERRISTFLRYSRASYFWRSSKTPRKLVQKRGLTSPNLKKRLVKLEAHFGESPETPRKVINILDRSSKSSSWSCKSKKSNLQILNEKSIICRIIFTNSS